MFEDDAFDEEDEIATHMPCPDCGSSDALTVYTNGTKCFSCDKFTPNRDKKFKKKVSQKADASTLEAIQELPGTCKGLTRRNLSVKTCGKYGVTLGKMKGQGVYQFPYYHQNKLVSYKIKTPKKEMWWQPSIKGSKVELFGQHLVQRGRKLVITEGEEDAMSVYQAFGCKYPAVSVPSGATSAKKFIKMNIEFVEAFEEIVLAFDGDTAGQEAVEDVAPLLTPGKVKVVKYPDGIKDFNDLIVKGRSKEIPELIYAAMEHRPDCIVAGSELTIEQLREPIHGGYPIIYQGWSAKTYGLRKGEITMVTAGSGIGKSTILREVAYDLVAKQDLTVAMVYLEENMIKTAQGFIAIDNNVPLAELRQNPNAIADEDYEASYERLIKNDSLYFYNHFGSLAVDNLISRLKFLAVGCEVDFIFLDHVSIVVSGNASDNERKDIDILMTNLRSLVESTGVGAVVVSHLKRGDTGKGYNEGRQISLKDLRGSGSLEQLSDNVVAFERDQQDELRKHVSTVRVLKCRETGETGLAGELEYDPVTGRLLDKESTEEETNYFGEEDEFTG